MIYARINDYFYILFTLILTAFGQILLKWRIEKFGALPDQASGKAKFILTLLLDPCIIAGFGAAFLASITWMMAMTKFNLSYAHPFTSLNFVIVLFLSRYILDEPLSFQKVVGIMLIVVGTIVVARG